MPQINIRIKDVAPLRRVIVNALASNDRGPLWMREEVIEENDSLEWLAAQLDKSGINDAKDARAQLEPAARYQRPNPKHPVEGEHDNDDVKE